MDKEKSIALVDFDNTLFFTDKALRYATKEMFGKTLRKAEIKNLEKRIKRRVYKLAQSKYRQHSVPHSFLISRLKSSKNLRIVIMTARPLSLKKHSVDLLKSQRIHFDAIIMRNKWAVSLKDEEWKLRQIRKFLKLYRSVSYYDDKKDNVMYVKRAIKHTDRLHLFLVLRNKVREIK